MARKLYGAAARAHARRLSRIGGKRRTNRRRHSVKGHYQRSAKGKRFYVAPHASNRRRHKVRGHRQRSRSGRMYSVRPHMSNPRSIVRFVMDGAIDGFEVVLGKAGTNLVASKLPAAIPSTGIAGQAVRIIVASGLGIGASKFVSPNAGKMVLAGGLASVIEGLIKQFNVPLLAASLSGPGDFYAVGAYPSVGAYPALPAPSVASYPGIAGEDDVTAAEYGI